MFFIETLEHVIKKGQVAETLYRNSPARFAVRSLQIVLYKLGFGEELSWSKYMADGGYGGGTTKAMAAWMALNDVSGDPEKVSQELAEKLLQAYELRGDLHRLLQAMAAGSVSELYSQEMGEDTNIRGLQRMLNFLGYGEQLRWDEFGAQGLYSSSTIAAVKAFAQKEGISAGAGTELTHEMALRLKALVQARFGGKLELKEEKLSKSLEVRTERIGNRIHAHDSFFMVRMVPHQQGVYVIGSEEAESFVDRSRQRLLDQGLSESAIRVMLPVSANEGNLDAINTWDNAFLSFGMYQWTLGVESAKGELPALLAKIKLYQPSAFQQYFGQYGLDVVDSETNKVYGYLSLDGRKLRSPADKSQLRTHSWGFRFWRAGLDPRIKEIEIQHAFARIYTFYQHSNYKVGDYFVSDLIRSEYGVALLLDHHVNRPAHPRKHLAQALEQTGLSSKEPNSWSSQDEGRLIEAYLSIRAQSSMTKPKERAATTQRFLQSGKLSDARGSFQVQATMASRSLDAEAASPDFFPDQLGEGDFPAIGGDGGATTGEEVSLSKENWFARLWKSIFG